MRGRLILRGWAALALSCALISTLLASGDSFVFGLCETDAECLAIEAEVSFQ